MLDQLHAKARRQRSALALGFLGQVPRLLSSRPLGWRAKPSFLDDKLVPVSREQGALLYLLTRAVRARRVVEFGTSFGVSTLYLATAVRDEIGQNPTGMRTEETALVTGTEVVPEKAEAARRNIERAGLSAYVEIRVGDAVRTLSDLGAAFSLIDLVLLDGWPALSLDVLRVVEPAIRSGGIVVIDDTRIFRGDLKPLLGHLADPANGYRGVCELGIGHGLAFAVRA